MTLTVRLLGRPALERDGLELRAPRGRKSWALLAYLLLADRPPSRHRLATLLFSDAVDPLAALRWTLSEVRRCLGDGLTIGGDPLTVVVGDDTTVDLAAVVAGRAADLDAEQLQQLGGPLLDGIEVPSSPAFGAWLAVHRQRLAAASAALLYDRALSALSAGRPETAAALAARVVEIEPLVADHHTLLVRSLAQAGDVHGARLQAERCNQLFQRELGQDAPLAVARAADITPSWVRGDGVSSATARSYLDAGRASLSAGATDLGLSQLRRSVTAARRAGDAPLTAVALVALAGGEIHNRGQRGSEVAALLHESLDAARAAGDAPTAAAACRELAFIAVQLGQQARADAWLTAADAMDVDDDERSRLLGVRGMGLSDAADYPRALEVLERSVELATAAGAARQGAWSRTMIGRVHLLRGDVGAATAVLDDALGTARETRWTAFLPWVEALRADAALEAGATDEAQDLLDHAWVLASETQDHCWLSTVSRGQVRLATHRGDAARAVRWVDRGLSPTPWYLWLSAHLLDAGCEAAVRAYPVVAERWAGDLSGVAARGGMREHVARAHLHHARLGSPDAIDAARLAAEPVDNARLHALLSDWSS